MSTRADDYRQRARAADRRAAQTSDPHIRGAYEQITRDWLALAEQVEWIDSYRRSAADHCPNRSQPAIGNVRRRHRRRERTQDLDSIVIQAG
jgi:hypothetical protein